MLSQISTIMEVVLPHISVFVFQNEIILTAQYQQTKIE